MAQVNPQHKRKQHVPTTRTKGHVLGSLHRLHQIACRRRKHGNPPEPNREQYHTQRNHQLSIDRRTSIVPNRDLIHITTIIPEKVFTHIGTTLQQRASLDRSRDLIRNTKPPRLKNRDIPLIWNQSEKPTSP
ncbi:hypothetical protein YC2023_023578 [Brassica napus]